MSKQVHNKEQDIYHTTVQKKSVPESKVSSEDTSEDTSEKSSKEPSKQMSSETKIEPKAIEMLPLHDRIVEALRSIYDPELPVNIYDLGLIYKIDIQEQEKITIQMTLTSPGCPVAETFPQTIQERILTVKGVSSVIIDLVWEPAWSKECMSEAARLQLNMF